MLADDAEGHYFDTPGAGAGRGELDVISRGYCGAIVMLIGLCLVMALPSLSVATAEEEEAPKAGWSVTPMPVIFSTPETGFALGVGTFILHRPAGASPEVRPRSIDAIGFYTTKKQTVLAVVPEIYLQQDRWRLWLSVEYMKIPRSFYGVGPNTAKGDKESLTMEGGLLHSSLTRRVYRALWSGLFVAVKGVSYPKKEDGGLLDSEMVTGHDGGLYTCLGPIIRWDSCDNIFYPSAGSLHQLSATWYSDRIGSDLDYAIRTLDLRFYRSIHPGHILALQLYGTDRRGSVPLLDLAPIGGMLRGINEDRFRDRAMAMAQFEYRYPVLGRFTGTAFVGAGDVSEGLEKFRAGDAKVAYGLGLRFAVNPEKVNIRMDLGSSDYGTEVYFQINEAF